MQRMGGGSRKRGGGNDPRCGCDMRVGWESSFGDVKQLGGGCGCGLWKGGKRKGTRKNPRGGAQDFNPAPVHFKDFGVTLSDTRADVSSIANYAGKGGASDLVPSPVHFNNFGRTISNTRANVSSIANYNAKGGKEPDFPCPFPGTGYCTFYAKGGANYGEPMFLQAKLRGGGMNGCGCLTNPVIRGYGTGSGGYRMTKRNRKYLKRYKQGKSIGFTMTSSLKAKGLIPRTSRKHKGKKIVSAKYK
jgi:hypothetical protein